MRATLIKIKSNHENIADKYDGVINELPRQGECFILSSPTTNNEAYKDHNQALFIRTTPVLKVNKLNDKVIEFETKNSKYSLEIHA